MKNNRIVIFGWADSVHVQRWCKGLTGRGFEIKLISVVDGPVDSVEKIVLSDKSGLSYLTNISKAKEEALKFNPDLVHAHYVAGNGLLAWRSGIQPFLGSVWGADVIDLPQQFIYRMLVRKVLKAATYLTATSEFLKEVSAKLEPSAQNKILVIPFGVTVPKDTFAIPTSSDFKLCFVKSLKKKYGADILLQAMSRVVKTHPRVKLTIAGDGPMKNEILKMINDLGLKDNVSIIGFMPNEKVYELIQEHHLMVMPSVMESESFGVAAIEAGACARPVIASRVGGVPEVVIDRQTGVLVEPGDPEELSKSIIELADNITLCHQMGQKGYERVRKNYDWEKSLDMMSELYERLIYESKKD